MISSIDLVVNASLVRVKYFVVSADPLQNIVDSFVVGGEFLIFLNEFLILDDVAWFCRFCRKNARRNV